MSPSHPPEPDRLPDPELRVKRVTRYWHKHGKYPFDEPGYDPATGLVTDPNKPKLAHRRTRALPQQSTSAQAHTQSRPNLSVYLEHLKPNIPIADPSEGDEGSDVTSSRTPYHMNPLVQAEKEEREALGITPRDYGNRWKAAYRELIDPRPDCGPGDHAAAEMYWARICRALYETEGYTWTPNENTRLHILERKWRKRKDGEDARFEVAGNRPGRLSVEEQERVEGLQAMIEINRRAKGEWES